MSVSTVSSTSAAATGHTQHQDPMTDVAKLLDMSTSDLRDALKSGSSLSDVAAKQGVSRDDLLKTISSDIRSRPGQSGTSSQDVDAEAAKIADTKGLPKHHGHHKHGGAGAVSGSGLTPATTDPSTVSAQAETGSVDVLL